MTVPSRGGGRGGVVPEKRGVEALFYVLQSEAYILLCLFASAFAKRPYQAEQQKKTPIHSQFLFVIGTLSFLHHSYG